MRKTNKSKGRHLLKISGSILLLSVVFSSCKKEQVYDDLKDNPYVATYYDVTTNFSQYSTFYINDTIIVISDDPSEDTLLTGSNAATIVNQIKSEMQNRGYTFTPNKSVADLAITTSVIHNLTVGTYYYPGYYYGYYGYYYPVYWGYPYSSYYYGYSYTYVYESGSFWMELLDLKNVAENEDQIKVTWTSIIGNLYDTNIDATKAAQSISQAFTQSDYLRK